MIDDLNKRKYDILSIKNENGTTTDGTIQLLLKNILKHDGYLLFLNLDRNSQFISQISKILCKILDILPNLSTFFQQTTYG